MRVAKQYLSYFQGSLAEWACADQRRAAQRHPRGSQAQLRRAHGDRRACSTPAACWSCAATSASAWSRRWPASRADPVGVIANNPGHLAGAIDSDGADKAARFMQLCDAFDIPIVTLVDTPGMMVGPAVEQTALVRHCSRLFVTGANLTVPMVSVVLRKSYGLGAQAMMGGSTKAPAACVAWPTGEFGRHGPGGRGAARATARSSRRSTTPTSATPSFQTDGGRGCTSTARR